MKRLLLPLALWSLVLGAACNPPKTAVAGKATTTPTGSSKPQVFAPPTPGTGPSYTLRLKGLKPGDVWKYDYEVKTFADPKGAKTTTKGLEAIKEYTEANVTGTVELKVKEVMDGKTTFVKTNTVTKASATGVWKQQADEMKGAPPDVATYTWDDRLSNVAIDKNEYFDPMTNSMHTLFPKEPVQVGSSWEYQPFPAYKVTSKAKVVKEETIAGTKTLRIDLVLPASTEGEVNNMSVWVDPTTGRYLRVEMHSTSSQEGIKVENHFVQSVKP